DVAVGCGGLRGGNEGVAEIKRMFVSDSQRGTGVGKVILGSLEFWERELGYTTLVLETSKRLSSAVGLYSNADYAIIPNFSPYVGIEDSVCMAKDLRLA